MERLTAAFPRLVWLNPEPMERWDHTPSIRLARELVSERMYPLTLEGLDRAMTQLRRREARRMPPPQIPPLQPLEP
jgi:uncharacterized protein with von Willebrand factor type A (vWA) domain